MESYFNARESAPFHGTASGINQKANMVALQLNKNSIKIWHDTKFETQISNSL